MRTITVIAILALLTISGAVISDQILRGQEHPALLTDWKSFWGFNRLGGRGNAFNRSIPAFYQRAGRPGGVPDRLPGFGSRNFLRPADERREGGLPDVRKPLKRAGRAGLSSALVTDMFPIILALHVPPIAADDSVINIARRMFMQL
jgi:hypothetical protein